MLITKLSNLSMVQINPSIDCTLCKGDPEVRGIRKLIVVKLDQPRHSFVHRRQLNQSHLTIVGKKLKVLHVKPLVLESLLDISVFDSLRDVGQVENV